MVDRMQNKSEINCQMMVLERRSRTGILFHAVSLVRWQKRTVCKVAELCSWGSLHSLTSHQTFSSIPCTENHLHTKRFLQCHKPIIDIKNKVSAVVKNRRVFVSLYKQRVFYCVFHWLCVTVCVYVWVQMCVSNFVLPILRSYVCAFI